MRNKRVGVKVSPFLLPSPVSPSLYFQLLYAQVCCLAGEKVGLWSVHHCSSLGFLPPPVFPLLWCGIWMGFRGISGPVPGAAACPFLGSLLPPHCSHLSIYILCIHQWQTICFIKPLRAYQMGRNGSCVFWELLSCTSSSSNLVFCSSFIFYHVSITFYSGKFVISVNCWSSNKQAT